VTRRLSGIIPPLVRPLKDRDELDQAGLERLIEHVVGGGVHGLFILGTTGEAPSLSYRLRRECIGRVCQLAKGRLPGFSSGLLICPEIGHSRVCPSTPTVASTRRA
jgi:4-hydroxy-tetrahydrodipicolinate synthase